MPFRLFHIAFRCFSFLLFYFFIFVPFRLRFPSCRQPTFSFTLSRAFASAYVSLFSSRNDAIEEASLLRGQQQPARAVSTRAAALGMLRSEMIA